MIDDWRLAGSFLTVKIITDRINMFLIGDMIRSSTAVSKLTWKVFWMFVDTSGATHSDSNHISFCLTLGT